MDGKLIIFGPQTHKVMTFEDLFEKYKKFIRKKACSWYGTYEFDEVYQEALIAFWKCYINYDAHKIPVAFGYIVGRYIDNALIHYHNRNKPKTNLKTAQVKSIVSLNAIVFDEKDEGIELANLIGEEETYTQQTVDRVVLDKIFKKFTKQQRKDIEDYLSGYRISEMAEGQEVSSQAVSARIKNSFMKFRALYIKEMMA